MKNGDYLQECLQLHGDVAVRRYGKTQRLGELEDDVRAMLECGRELWDVIRAIHAHDAFPADMFGFLPEEQIGAQLRAGGWHRQWRELPRHQLLDGLYRAFRQIEPVSMILRFVDPTRYGIMSGPVAAVLGVRPRRKATATYIAYLNALGEVAEKRGFARVADVEMALWALQVGALADKLLPLPQRDALARSYRNDAHLRQLQTRNLIVHLFRERTKLDIAESLLATDAPLAGQIAGIEFEQLVGKVRFAGAAGRYDSLKALIDRPEMPDKARLHAARKIRNRAIHEPQGVKRADVERLISTARWVSRL